MPQPGLERLRALLDQALSGDEARRALAVVAPLAGELDRYLEIIAAPLESSFGFMTRGEDAGFTQRSSALLAQLGMPAAAIDHHRMLASWFEHKRAFIKVEWKVAPGAAASARASCYFRRRPALADVVSRLRLGGPTLEAVRDVARATGKRSVHFVAAAFAAGRPVDQKLYFSQYAAPEDRSQMTEQLGTLLDRFSVPPRARELFGRVHPRCLPAGSPTFYVSINFGPEGPAPSLKLDYPDVPAATAVLWLPEGAVKDAAEALADRLCATAGTRELTYLGVRFQAGDDAVRLKYYVDFPTERGS